MFNNYNLRPMLLKEVFKPFQDTNYLYELKFDGIRVLLYVNSKSIKCLTRNGHEVSILYPELAEIKQLVGHKSVIFDGEIVAFKNGKPSFSELQKRSHLKNKLKIKSMMSEIPIAFIAFDILYEDEDITSLPLEKRKDRLNNYPDTDIFIKSICYDNGINLFKQVKKLGLEGIVAKEKNSLYFPVKRVDTWLKIKNFQKGKFYIHGFIINKEKLSLLLGEYHQNNLYYVGKASIMLNTSLAKIIQSQPRVSCKFINEHEKGEYIKPTHQILVHYMEKTPDNILRQPFIRR